jgi:hypothetical protein
MDRSFSTFALKSKCYFEFSVEGMNLDFLAMNLTGYTFYSLYCAYGYFNPMSES